MTSDAHAILGLVPGATVTATDVRKAFRAALRLVHPDVAGTDAGAGAVTALIEAREAVLASIGLESAPPVTEPAEPVVGPTLVDEPWLSADESEADTGETFRPTTDVVYEPPADEVDEPSNASVRQVPAVFLVVPAAVTAALLAAPVGQPVRAALLVVFGLVVRGVLAFRVRPVDDVDI